MTKNTRGTQLPWIRVLAIVQQHRPSKCQQKVGRYLAQLGDLEMLADLVASTFVDDPLRRQRMLEESSLNQRLRLLITYLQDEIGSAAV
jgi:ATP-dependent Lon protease